MLLVCPRCSGSLPSDARACPRCGLLLSTAAGSASRDEAGAVSTNGRDTQSPGAELDAAQHPVAIRPLSSAHEGAQDTAPYSGAFPYSSLAARPRIAEAQSEPVPQEGRTASGALLVPRGAIEMLPNESVVFQLGALYLTNKRVILLAPSVVRMALVRDVDAIGTLTERGSAWSFFFGLLLLGLSGSALYFSFARAQYQLSLPTFYLIEPLILAVAFALLAVYLLANYFFWVKRTLFLSVQGRPLITVSITDWNAKKLEGMDAFINAYSQVKDSIGSSD